VWRRLLEAGAPMETFTERLRTSPLRKVEMSFAACKRFNNEQAALLVESLPGSLESLDVELHGSGVGLSGSRALFGVVGRLDEHLVRLRISGAVHGVSAVQALAKGLNDSALRHVDLGESQICGVDRLNSGTRDLSGLKKLAAWLAVNHLLTTLELGGCSIGDEGADVLAKALAENTTLETVGLRANYICTPGWCSIFRALRRNDGTRIVSWDLAGESSINNTVAGEIAKYLTESTTLSSLDISNNQIGPEGAEAIGRALEENRSLRKLALSGNKIGDRGGEALLKMLATNKRLRALDLSGRLRHPLEQQTTPPLSLTLTRPPLCCCAATSATRWPTPCARLPRRAPR
jgi:hypothetical protein